MCVHKVWSRRFPNRQIDSLVGGHWQGSVVLFAAGMFRQEETGVLEHLVKVVTGRVERIDTTDEVAYAASAADYSDEAGYPTIKHAPR